MGVRFSKEKNEIADLIEDVVLSFNVQDTITETEKKMIKLSTLIQMYKSFDMFNENIDNTLQKLKEQDAKPEVTN